MIGERELAVLSVLKDEPKSFNILTTELRVKFAYKVHSAPLHILLHRMKEKKLIEDTELSGYGNKIIRITMQGQQRLSAIKEWLTKL